MRKINCIGILTSGGDAPGMNAAIRAVTRAGIANGFRIMAIFRGYEGLINDDIVEFTTEDVSNIIQRGGTILKTARSKDFETVEGRQKAYENMQKRGIDALVVIGGNGSLTGARIFAQEFDVPLLVTNESSLWRLWGVMPVSWLRIVLSQQVQRLPSFRRTVRAQISWRNSLVGVFVRVNPAVSSLLVKVPNVVPCTMRSV